MIRLMICWHRLAVASEHLVLKMINEKSHKGCCGFFIVVLSLLQWQMSF
jgi:hypothetical protein